MAQAQVKSDKKASNNPLGGDNWDSIPSNKSQNQDQRHFRPISSQVVNPVNQQDRSHNALDLQNQLGEGKPMDSHVRSRMESAFGMSFVGVRTHTDSKAETLSREFGAQAFTVGKHVAFASGRYRPGTLMGDALIAHEMAHVAQQNGSSASVEPLKVGDDRPIEQDADRSAAGAIVSLWSGIKGTTSRIAANAVPRLRSGLRLSRCSEIQDYDSAAVKTAVEVIKENLPKKFPADAADLLEEWQITGILAAEKIRLDSCDNLGGSTRGAGQIGKDAITDVDNTFSSARDAFADKYPDVSLPGDWDEKAEDKTWGAFYATAYYLIEIEKSAKPGRTSDDQLKIALALYHGGGETVRKAQSKIANDQNKEGDDVYKITWAEIKAELLREEDGDPVYDKGKDIVDYVNTVFSKRP